MIKLNKNQIIALLLLGVFVVLAILINHRIHPKRQISGADVKSDEAKLSEPDLYDAVYNKIDAKTNGNWDKELVILQRNNNPDQGSKQAAYGTWKAHDQWEWFAWLSMQGEWQVLVSLDGWDCDELDSIAYENQQFFNKVTYKLPTGEKYCYDHSDKTKQTKEFIFPEVTDSVFSIAYPSDYTIVKNTNEPNRRGSVASYDFQKKSSNGLPHLAEVQIFTKASINKFLTACKDNFCFDGHYPTLALFDALSKASEAESNYQNYEFYGTANSPSRWLRTTHVVTSDTLNIREYVAFTSLENQTMVSVIIHTERGTKGQELADKLFDQLKITNGPK
jgi:hypothetical protein